MSWPPPPGGPFPAPTKMPAWLRGNPLESLQPPLYIQFDSRAQRDLICEHLRVLAERGSQCFEARFFESGDWAPCAEVFWGNRSWWCSL